MQDDSSVVSKPQDQTTQSMPLQGQDVQTQQASAASPSGVVGQKELAPVRLGGNGHEAPIVPSETEPVLHPEVAEVGVETRRDVPDLTPQDKKVGLSLAKEAVPVAIEPSGLVQLPVTLERAMALQKGNVSNSSTWQAALYVKDFLRKALEKLTNG